MSKEKLLSKRNIFKATSALAVPALIYSGTDTASAQNSPENTYPDPNRITLVEQEGRLAPVHDLRHYDINATGEFLATGPTGLIKSGDIIFRPNDGVTQVEEGQYIVPNNAFFVDGDADGILDREPRHARLVIVMRDSLTYLYQENSQNVIGVFPNGVGSAGSNSVASVRRINVRLGEQWGIDYSDRAGFEQNMFGIITLGTAYFINEDPANDIDTFQEVHGTPENLQFLLGREISGGCVRHPNEAIRVIASHVSVGDPVLTVESAQDDDIDNPINLYNRTRRAAGLELVQENFTAEDIGLEILNRPLNHEALSANLDRVETATWVNFDQIPLPQSYNIAEHPFTRGDYGRIPCGTETFSITEQTNERSRLVSNGEGYQLDVAQTLSGPNGEINVSDFYNPITVTRDMLKEDLIAFSGGDYSTAFFQYLIWDYAYQYGEFVAKRDSGNWDLNGEVLSSAVASLSDRQLREVQLVTGLIPVRFSTRAGTEAVAGERMAASTNRTLEHSLMNVFYGQQGEVYELDFRYSIDQQAMPVEDLPNYPLPSLDHEMQPVRGAERASVQDLLKQAIENKQSAIFRITNYRYQTEYQSYELGLPAAHYYAVISEYSNVEAGYIAVQDSMHPYDLLLVPFDEVASIFSTVTISPKDE